MKTKTYYEKLKKVMILFLFVLFYALIPLAIKAATLYLMPQSQTIYQGNTFIVEARLDTEDEEINAIKADLEFPPDSLEILDFNKGGSILTLWAREPVFSNEEGFISFAGGLPGGFKGKGLVLKMTFLAKEIGKASVSFKENSQVLLNDGKGTPAVLMFLEGDYKVEERPEGLPVIFSRTHPDQNKWHNQNTLHLQWNLVEGAQYSYLLSKDPLAKPDDIPDKPEGELIWMGDMEYSNLDDGIYYFHLRESRETDAKPKRETIREWGVKVTFRAMVDIIPPEEFIPEIGQDPSMFGGKYFLSFATTDKTSGIDYYEVREGKQDFKKTSSPYLLEDQSLGKEIIVRAYDKAGNERIAEIIPLEKPFPYLIIILVLVGATIIWWIVRKIRMKNIKPEI